MPFRPPCHPVAAGRLSTRSLAALAQSSVNGGEEEAEEAEEAEEEAEEVEEAEDEERRWRFCGGGAM